MTYMLLVIGTVLSLLTQVNDAAAELPPLETLLAERTLGSPNAPVTLIEVSSLTCPHCAAAHRDVLPKIKKEYVDTGKLRILYRDMPLNAPALAAAAVARCIEPQRYFAFLETLFLTQEQWAQSKDPRSELAKLARVAGLSQADFDACLKLQPLIDGLQKQAEAFANKHDITSTPTFLVGDRCISGALPYETFSEAIERALLSPGTTSDAVKCKRRAP